MQQVRQLCAKRQLLLCSTYSTATTTVLDDNVEDVRLDAVWYCAACRSTIDDDDRSVTCDSCLQWHHIRYVALKIAQKAR